MEYCELRDLVKTWPKYAGCIEVERAPLVTPAFPGTFNLSFTEDLYLKERGRYVDLDSDLIFSTIQTCVRPNDFELLSGENNWKYLAAFEMADLTGAVGLRSKPDYEKLQRMLVENMVALFECVGISKNRIYPTYCGGGSVGALTKGKYGFDFNIPADLLSRNLFIDSGIPSGNVRATFDRSTFLSLHLGRPTPWGYRCEIDVNVGSVQNPVFVDVATVEYLKWNPLFFGDSSRSANIVGLNKLGNGFSAIVFGLERLCMVVNNLERIQDVDYLKPFYDVLGNKVLAGESLRALHRIYSDVIGRGLHLGRQQKVKIRSLVANLSTDLTEDKMRELLSIHAQTQPWHNDLKANIEPTIANIQERRRTMKLR